MTLLYKKPAYLGDELELCLKEIENNVFMGCSSLEEIVIPSGVETIGNWAFRNCTSLTSVVLTEGLKKIDTYAFFPPIVCFPLIYDHPLKVISESLTFT